eukprot:m.58781 g.58781  ORF g.58781 m.58781 type:complete len:389 (+) comp13175_c0_seq1:94-1260(+)
MQMKMRSTSSPLTTMMMRMMMTTMMMTMVVALLIPHTLAVVPTVALFNTAEKGMRMPAIGLGTGGYNSNPAVGYNGYPECWAETTGCGNYTKTAVLAWLKSGGRRLDCANSYQNQQAVGEAMRESGVPRNEIFLLQKVGPSLPLGYQDALDQFEQIKSDMQVTYVDMLLVHWPTPRPSAGNVTSNQTESKDPYCQSKSPSYNETMCRLSTWKALVQIFNAGGARAIGVSNYNISHFQEIINAGLPLPSLTQNPYHLYRSLTQNALKAFTFTHNITFLGYSPLGVPDWHKFPEPQMSPTPLQDPVVLNLAKRYNKTPAQILIQWEWQMGVPVNPRSMNEQHMIENLAAYDFILEPADVEQLLSRPQDYCTVDPDFYECVTSQPGYPYPH